MQKEILIVDPNIKRDEWMESYISFQIFTDFLIKRIDEDDGTKRPQYQAVLDKIRQYPELQGNVPVEEMHQYEEVLTAIALLLFPMVEDENECLWALGNALTPEIFFSSNAFHNLLAPGSEVYIGNSFITPEESASLQKELMYHLILQQLYHYQAGQSKEWVQGFFNEATGLYQYFRINVDKRFAAVSARNALPQMGKSEIRSCLSCADGFEQLGRRMPIRAFVASGFSILTVTNVTQRHAIEEIGQVLIKMDKNNGDTLFLYITRLLKTIIGNRNYDFGIMPILTINNRAGLLYENFSVSILIKTCLEQGVPRKDFNHFINELLNDPKKIAYVPGLPNNVLPSLISNALDDAGIQFYSFMPVYNGEQLVGLFEISTKGAQVLSEHFLKSSLGPVVPHVSQILQHFIDKVDISIEAIIKDKFTTLQPSVQWKFNEVAWHYFRNNFIENKKTPLENISFTDVYPLYGAIDIRNSTIERNKALRKDLLIQLTDLRDILLIIENNFEAAKKDMLVQCDSWLYRLSDFISIEQELLLNDFLQLEIRQYLSIYEQAQVHTLDQSISEYYVAIDEATGIAFRQRRILESSIQTINTAIGQYFDLFKVELQSIYPCYFEKMRTDGVEYDIYIGQSIAPKLPFEMAHLQKVRLMQVQSMAAISLLTHSLLPRMEHELNTTQLLFVHSRPIDISFRNDERRFDVEGAYNIRYHIIKKRIDKVHIRNTDERLTQVGKIALVYYNEKDAMEYEIYIRQLQQMDILIDDLEFLELEELQGVSGLKALRVGVKFA